MRKYYTKGNPNPQVASDEWSDLFNVDGRWWGFYKQNVIPTELPISLEETTD